MRHSEAKLALHVLNDLYGTQLSMITLPVSLHLYKKQLHMTALCAPSTLITQLSMTFLSVPYMSATQLSMTALCFSSTSTTQLSKSTLPVSLHLYRTQLYSPCISVLLYDTVR